MASLTTIKRRRKYPCGKKVHRRPCTINITTMSNNFDQPHSPLERRYKLVSPFFAGSGKDFDTVIMFHSGPKLHSGMIFSTDKDDMIRVMAESIMEEDFFENITVTLCQLMTNDPNDVIDDRARELYYMYSAASEK
jgi:hypothetical protein